MLGTLRAVTAIFGARAGFNREQSADLDFIRIEMFAMNLLRCINKIVKRHCEQCLDLIQTPIVTNLSLRHRRTPRPLQGLQYLSNRYSLPGSMTKWTKAQ